MRKGEEIMAEVEFNALANNPVEMALGGKMYKVRRVSLNTIFGKAEANVISLQMKRIQEMAAGLEGDDKSSFLAKAMLESLPSGKRLNEMAAGYLYSVEGVKMVVYDALRQDHPGIEAEMDVAAAAKDEEGAVAAIVTYAIGGKKKSGDKSLPLANGAKKP